MSERFQIGRYWLSQRPNSPAWCRTWFEARQTRRASLGTESYEAAKKKLADWYVKHGDLPQLERDQVTLDALMVRYYEHHAIHTASAATAYGAIKKINARIPSVTVAGFNHATQTQLIADLRTEGLSDGYITRVMTVARAALNYAHKREELASVPHVLNAGHSEPRQRRLSVDEMTAFVNAINSEVLARYVLVALTTLARPAAVMELRWPQIRDGLVYLNPEGRKQTKKHRPTLPLTHTLARITRTESDYVIGKRLLSIKKPFATAAAKAKLTGISPYTLRHTMATELRARGVPPWELAGYMGHRIARTTEIYAAYAPDYLSHAKVATDAYMGSLISNLRASCVLVQCIDELIEGANPLIRLVGAGRIELPTPTMSRDRKPHKQRA
jgi:integrase